RELDEALAADGGRDRPARRRDGAFCFPKCTHCVAWTAARSVLGALARQPRSQAHSPDVAGGAALGMKRPAGTGRCLPGKAVNRRTFLSAGRARTRAGSRRLRAEAAPGCLAARWRGCVAIQAPRRAGDAPELCQAVTERRMSRRRASRRALRLTCGARGRLW